MLGPGAPLCGAAVPLRARLPASAVIVLVPVPNAQAGSAIARLPGVAAGLMSANVGPYDPRQMLLDIARGIPSGVVAHLSLGRTATPGARVAALRGRARLIVVEEPPGAAGLRGLRALVTSRPRSELDVAIALAPRSRDDGLLWIAAAGDHGAGALSSDTTRTRGLVAAIDVAPTILRFLRAPLPSAIRGTAMTPGGRLDVAALQALRSQLLSIAPRRLPALAWILAAWALLVALASPLRNPRRARRWAVRVGALGLMWAPACALLTAWLEPAAPTEYALLACSCLTMGALTDALVRWPRAPAVPALVALIALSVDALAGTQLQMRSLLGPNPAYGARFYGFGNVLKPILAVLAFSAVAALLHERRRPSQAAIAMALCGIVLALVEGPTAIGAAVGGVVLVAAGAAVAALVALDRTPTPAGAALAVGSPAIALGALAAIDLATSHGAGHFSGSILHARSATAVGEIVVHRFDAAIGELGKGAMPIASALALAAAVAGVRARRFLLAPLAGERVWVAALAGGLAAGCVGALVEDSGPVLLVVAVFALGCVLAYVHGRPPGLLMSHSTNSRMEDACTSSSS